MSEVLTGSPAGTIYGTYADALIYIDAKYGDAYRAWELLSAPDRKRTQLSAAAFLDRQAWREGYTAFSDRDALAAFRYASYELAVLIADDPEIVAALDQGSNIESVNAGGAGVSFFNPTSSDDDSAPTLPPVLEQLVGAYLAASSTTEGSPWGQSGACVNPFSACRDDGRDGPF